MSTPPPRPTERTTEDRERDAISKILEEGAKPIFEAIPFGEIHIARAMEELAHTLFEEGQKRRTRAQASTHGPPPINPRPYTEGGELASAPPTSQPAGELRFPLPARIPTDLRPAAGQPRDMIATDALPTALASTDPPGSGS